MNERRTWLIAYDIKSPKRLSHLYRLLKTRAIAVQYSVFMFDGRASDLGSLLTEIRYLLDPKEDDVRAYPIPQRLEAHVIGRGSIPESACIVSADRPAIQVFTNPVDAINLTSAD